MLYTIGGASYVNIAYYVQIKNPGAHIQNLSLKDGRVLQVRTDGVIADIPFPGSTPPQTIDTITPIIAQTELLSSRYPQYSSVLASVGNAWKKILSEEQQKVAIALQTAKEEEERQKQIDIEEKRKQEQANKMEQERQRLREEQQAIRTQSDLKMLSTLADAVSWAVETNSLNRKSLIEHSGIDDNNWLQFVEKSTPSPTTEKAFELLSVSKLASDREYILSFARIFSVVDMVSQNRLSSALLELETLIGPNTPEDKLKSGSRKLFLPLTESLKKKILESDILRYQAQDLIKDKKYSAARELIEKASLIDRRVIDEDTLKKCKELEQKYALETLGI